jgi:hypothetical protein
LGSTARRVPPPSESAEPSLARVTRIRSRRCAAYESRLPSLSGNHGCAPGALSQTVDVPLPDEGSAPGGRYRPKNAGFRALCSSHRDGFRRHVPSGQCGSTHPVPTLPDTSRGLSRRCHGCGRMGCVGLQYRSRSPRARDAAEDTHRHSRQILGLSPLVSHSSAIVHRAAAKNLTAWPACTTADRCQGVSRFLMAGPGPDSDQDRKPDKSSRDDAPQSPRSVSDNT